MARKNKFRARRFRLFKSIVPDDLNYILTDAKAGKTASAQDISELTEMIRHVIQVSRQRRIAANEEES